MGPSVGVRPRFSRVQWKRGEGKGEGDDTPAAGAECGGAPADGGGGVANGGARRVAREREPSHLGGTVQVLCRFRS